MAINNIPPPGSVLENIEMGNHNELPGDTVVERSKGEFLMLDRFYSHSREDRDGLPVLIYGVQRRLTPEEFYGLLGQRSTGICTADDVSDHLVNAFDRDLCKKLGKSSALWAWRAPSGHIIHQHST